VELAALRETLADSEPGHELASLGDALARTVRRQQRVRRAINAGSLLALMLAAASGAWLTMGRGGDDPTASQVASHGPARAEARQLVATAPNLVADVEPVAAEAGDSALVWLQAHLSGHMIKQPDLEEVGLRFVGGSQLKSAQGPAIRLVYGDSAGRVYTFFAGTRQSGVELVPVQAPEGNVAMSWQQGPLAFALVAPQDSTRLTDIMKTVGELVDDPPPVSADAGAGAGQATSGTGASASDATAPAKGDLSGSAGGGALRGGTTASGGAKPKPL
jgi:hypothetical protein